MNDYNNQLGKCHVSLRENGTVSFQTHISMEIIEDEALPNISLESLLLQLYEYMHNSIFSKTQLLSLLSFLVVLYVMKLQNGHKKRLR